MELLYGMLGFCIVIFLGVIKERKDALNNKNKAAGHCIVNKISEMYIEEPSNNNVNTYNGNVFAEKNEINKEIQFVDYRECCYDNKLRTQDMKNGEIPQSSIQVNEFNLSIFMKLGVIQIDNGVKINGRNTIRRCYDKIQNIGYIWICTNSLNRGMAKDKVNLFNFQIHSGNRVKIYFALNDYLINNDIAYSANILEIVSSPTKIVAPCEYHECTEGFWGLSANIWLKITKIEKENIIKANNMVIFNTGNNLKDVISKGQFSFGYILKKGSI